MPIDRAWPGWQGHRLDAATTLFDATLHRLSRWTGYASLGAVYVALGCYLLR